ncbi:TonB family protein [Aliikangiella marina]|uniref:TonB family protein n=1 Tax=Aliikangiella marina TaxID=1712262 RepID=A0A545TCU1_9GAMM|nr:TonB family protein [Aliikangiella marina]TQV75029.1 TonB family protein [Aliikangiella marina]
MHKIYSILLLIIFSPAVLADFNAALDAYESGNLSDAYSRFKSMGELGDSRSQFNLGAMYFNGESVDKDVNLAYAWMKLAIKSDNATEQQKSVFELVSSKVKDKEKAEKAYRVLEAKYSSEALLANLYPVIVKPENDNAFAAKPTKIVDPKYPRKAAMKGISGWVRFQFDVDKIGAPRNLVLLESFPDDMFVDASQRAIKKWRFEPATDSQGVSNVDKGLTYTMEYKIGVNGKAAKLLIKEDAYNIVKSQALQGDAVSQFKFGFMHKKFSDLEEDVNPNDWFLKAAVQDFPLAQYQLGLSLIKGQGCLEDKAKGIEWLSRSAASGLKDANEFLGTLASEVQSQESHQKAVQLFSAEKELSSYAKLDYAWLLATSPYQDVANPKLAIKLAEDLDHREFWDEATQYEIKAAAFAALGDYKKAVDLQQEALDEADDMNVDLSIIEERLSLYKKNQKWF